jgi:hypothetical protein
MHFAQIVVDHVAATRRCDIHYLHCPHCATGSKCITFIAGDTHKRPIIVGKYASCSCILTETERQALIREASKEAGVI